MALVSMRQLLDHAAENGYGVPAFNVNNIEQVQAIMEAAREVNAPVIMQASAGARKYAGELFLKHLIQAAVESYPDLPVAMHQDHGQSPAVCEGAIKLGFSSVMMDGSLREDGKTIADYDYNWQTTKKVVDMAHKLGVSVEGELGCLGSLETMRGDKEDGHGTESTMTREQLLTDPDQAADFVKKTQLDALAIAIGTSHGAYKFTRKPTGDILAIERIKAIHRRIPNTHLVMHGSSSVPQDLLAVPVRADVPLFGVVSRMVLQKGTDIIAEAIHRILSMDVQFVMIGNGEPWAHFYFGDIAAKYPEKFACHIGYSEALAHKVEAGADFFVMPSAFEPCGLNQMYSLAYGTPPIVRATGGLDDSVENFDEARLTGDGFKFYQHTALALFDTIGWAAYTFFNNPKGLASLRKNGMAKRFTWEEATLRYEELYRLAVRRRRGEEYYRNRFGA